MKQIKYQEIHPITVEEAERSFLSSDIEKVSYALIAISYYEPNWTWAQNKCLEYLEKENPRLSSLAATCLGHIARVNKMIEKERVLEALKNHLNNPEISGFVEDAIDDINLFVG